jgi:MazG family protein
MEQFQRLVDIMARLRAPDGCPWDREQTFDSIKKYTLEETYEVLDAIDRRDWSDLRDELGDFLLQAVFYAQMASEENLFDIAASLDAINEKLIRRHPHIFAPSGEGSVANTEAEVKKRWDEIKAEERAGKAEAPQGLLDTVPRALPALVEAQQITSRAAGVGFDWAKPEEVLDKLHEELAEFETARRGASQADIEDELGDLLFTIVNLARFVKVDPEQALRRTNAKFRGRFGYVERRLEERGRKVSGTPVAELEELWQEAKKSPAQKATDALK